MAGVVEVVVVMVMVVAVMAVVVSIMVVIAVAGVVAWRGAWTRKGERSSIARSSCPAREHMVS